MPDHVKYAEDVRKAATVLGHALQNTIVNARAQGAIKKMGRFLLDDAAVNALRVVYKKAVLVQIENRHKIDAVMWDALDRTLDDVLIRMCEDLHAEVRERLEKRDALIANNPVLCDGRTLPVETEPEEKLLPKEVQEILDEANEPFHGDKP